MLNFKKNRFTLVEILTVIAIISILAGLLSPSLLRTKQTAREVRWLACNSGINRDGDTVLNYNFMYDDYMIKSGTSLVPALRNGAVGCTVDGFDPKNYDGIIMGSYEWRKGAGRWNGFNNALQFDGISTYIEIPGGKVLNFDPSKDEFTAMAWIFLDNLSSPQTLFFKSQLTNTALYELTIYNSKIEATVSGVSKSWNQSRLNAGKWTHIAIVSVNASCKVYINGADLDGVSANNTSVGDVPLLCKIFPAGIPFASMTMASFPIQLAANTNANSNAQGNTSGTTVTPPSGATTQGQGNAYGTSNNSSNNSSNAQSSNTDPTVSAQRMHIGASVSQNGGTAFSFSGKMDEFVFIKRALPPSEIKGHWKMGNPY